MARHDLYGAQVGSLAELVAELEKVLGVEFVLRDSMYRGGDYYRHDGCGGDVLLQRNLEDDEGYLAEPTFPQYPILLYVSGASERYTVLLTGMSRLELLRSEVF
jgi:hypothetical protein